MKDIEKQEIEFYKNGSAEAVLKRFVFSEEEEKLVRDAMRTANMPKPRMALIHQADELLKDVAVNRTPITLSKDIDEMELKKQIHMAHYSPPETGFWKKPIDKSTIPLIGIFVWAASVITVYAIWRN
jgi:hypothetical protein